jgi:hypothetical protein
VIGDENGEDPGEPVAVRSVVVAFPLAPRHHVRSSARRVQALEVVPAVEGGDLTAYKSAGVLAGVEVVQGALEVEGAPAVAGEQQDERRVPHEQALVEGRVDKAGDEAAPGLGPAQIAERQLPRPAVTFYCVLMALPGGMGHISHALSKEGAAWNRPGADSGNDSPRPAVP